MFAKKTKEPEYVRFIKKRRSIRAFKRQRDRKGKIQQIMKAVLLSPSSKNNNPWKFLIVQEKDLLLKTLKKPKHMVPNS